MTSKNIRAYVTDRNWTGLITSFGVSDLSSILSFPQGLFIANELFCSGWEDSKLQEYAVGLLEELRRENLEAWEADWRHDVLLGRFCEFIWKYRERYQAYMRAYRSLANPPPVLLVSLAGCNSEPGEPSVDYGEAEQLLRRAFDQEASAEAACQLRGIYLLQNEIDKAELWERRWKELEGLGQVMDLTDLEPIVLRNKEALLDSLT